MRTSLAFLLRVALASSLATFVLASASAQPAAPSQASLDAAQIAQILGPAQVPLRDQATLKLPANAVFIPVPAATAVLHSMGAAADDQLLGVVLPQGPGSGVVVVQFVGQGYVKDADAKRWRLDGLLKNLQAFPPPSAPPTQVTGWAQAPRYDANSQRLAWAVATRIPNAPAEVGVGVNFNAYALGRDGYLRLNLVASASQWIQQQATAEALLVGLEFIDGKKYANYTSSGKAAPYGLAMLVGGPGAAAAVAASPAVWLLPLAGLALVLLGVLGVRWWLRRSAAKKAKERRDFQETSQATQFQETKQGPFNGDIGDLPTDRLPLGSR
jgi:uncharacterized membrane-anchored protein